MACNIPAANDRMTTKLSAIKFHATKGLDESFAQDYDGAKYRILSREIGKIAVLVRDTLTVRDYWYAKFVEEGVLVQPEEKKCDWDSNRCGSGCLVYDDNVKMSKTIVTLKSEIEALKNGDNTEMR